MANNNPNIFKPAIELDALGLPKDQIEQLGAFDVATSGTGMAAFRQGLTDGNNLLNGNSVESSEGLTESAEYNLGIRSSVVLDQIKQAKEAAV